MNIARPQLILLNEEQILLIHRKALQILAESGVRVDSPPAVDHLERTGQARTQGRNVKLDPELVEAAIRSAPSKIQVYDRRENPAFRLGADRLACALLQSPHGQVCRNS